MRRSASSFRSFLSFCWKEFCRTFTIWVHLVVAGSVSIALYLFVVWDAHLDVWSWKVCKHNDRIERQVICLPFWPLVKLAPFLVLFIFECRTPWSSWNLLLKPMYSSTLMMRETGKRNCVVTKGGRVSCQTRANNKTRRLFFLSWQRKKVTHSLSEQSSLNANYDQVTQKTQRKTRWAMIGNDC